MNLKIIFVSLLLLAASIMVQAQGQGFTRRTVEERVKRVVDTLTTVFKLEKNVQDQTSAVFTDYYKATDKLREGLADGERPDRTQMDKLVSERDEKLKKVLNEDQFKKYKDEIEPALRQRRRQG
jgi:membrane-associated HD superfamily phosphohydrolase